MMIPVFTSFMQALGIVALVAFALEASLRLLPSERTRTILASLVFASGVVCTMAVPFEWSPGLNLDLRKVFLILAPFYGGFPAAIATTIAAAIFRVYLGGVGLSFGLFGILICAAFGLWASRTPRLFNNTLRSAALLGLGGALSFATVLVLPWPMASAIIVTSGVAQAFATFSSVFIAAIVLRRETQAVVREVTLTHEAETDALTGLYNERAFNRLAPTLFDRAARYAQPCSLLMIDIEGMKTVNDHFGRNARDIVLQKASRVIVGAIPQGHLVARVGAQEFAIMLLAKDAEQAVIVAERIRAAVAAEDFNFGKGSAHLLVSIGLDAPGGHDAFDSALERVDAALHRAKRMGCNRVEIAEAA